MESWDIPTPQLNQREEEREGGLFITHIVTHIVIAYRYTYTDIPYDVNHML